MPFRESHSQFLKSRNLHPKQKRHLLLPPPVTVLAATVPLPSPAQDASPASRRGGERKGKMPPWPPKYLSMEHDYPARPCPAGTMPHALQHALKPSTSQRRSMQTGEIGLKLQCVRFNFTYSGKEKPRSGAGLFPASQRGNWAEAITRPAAASRLPQRPSCDLSSWRC